MDELTKQAIMTIDPHEGIKAVDALASFGEEAIPKLLKISDFASLANKYVKQAANSEIEKIKK